MPMRHVLAALLASLFVAIGLAQPPGPAAPAVYDVTIRYRINAFGNDSIMQYLAMVNYLKSIGFVREAPEDVPANEPEDQKATRMSGSLPAGKVNMLFGDRHIKAVRLIPKGARTPDDKDKRVRVNL